MNVAYLPAYSPKMAPIERYKWNLRLKTNLNNT